MKNTINLRLIREMREDKDFTQKELANILHIQSQAYSKKENGINEFSAVELKEVADYLGVDISSLYHCKRTETNNENLLQHTKELEKYIVDIRYLFMNYFLYTEGVYFKDKYRNAECAEELSEVQLDSIAGRIFNLKEYTRSKNNLKNESLDNLKEEFTTEDLEKIKDLTKDEILTFLNDKDNFHFITSLPDSYPYITNEDKDNGNVEFYKNDYFLNTFLSIGIFPQTIEIIQSLLNKKMITKRNTKIAVDNFNFISKVAPAYSYNTISTFSN